LALTVNEARKVVTVVDHDSKVHIGVPLQ